MGVLQYSEGHYCFPKYSKGLVIKLSFTVGFLSQHDMVSTEREPSALPHHTRKGNATPAAARGRPNRLRGGAVFPITTICSYAHVDVVLLLSIVEITEINVLVYEKCCRPHYNDCPFIT